MPKSAKKKVFFQSQKGAMAPFGQGVATPMGLTLLLFVIINFYYHSMKARYTEKKNFRNTNDTMSLSRFN